MLRDVKTFEQYDITNLESLRDFLNAFGDRLPEVQLICGEEDRLVLTHENEILSDGSIAQNLKVTTI